MIVQERMSCMVKNVKLRGNLLTIEWDQADHDYFFRMGLQLIADNYFGGKRKVVVLDPALVGVKSVVKKVEFSDEFANEVAGEAVRHVIAKYICSLDSDNRTGEGACSSKTRRKTKKTPSCRNKQ